MRRSTAWLISIATLGVLGVAFVWPLAWVIRGGFLEDGRFTLRFLDGVFRNPVYVEGLIRSLWIAVGTTTLVLLIAVPLAWMANRYQFPGKPILQALLLVPMILPPFVGAIGFQQIFGVYGSFNVLLARWTGLGPIDVVGQAGYWGVIALQALSLYPVMYLNVVAALGQRRSGHGAGGRQSRRARCHPVSPDHPAPDHARPLRGRRHRVRVGLHRARHAADHAVHALHARADLRRPQGDRHQPISLRPRLRDAGGERGSCTRSLGSLLGGGQSYALQAKATVAAAPVPLGLVGRVRRTAGLRRRSSARLCFRTWGSS